MLRHVLYRFVRVAYLLTTAGMAACFSYIFYLIHVDGYVLLREDHGLMRWVELVGASIIVLCGLALTGFEIWKLKRDIRLYDPPANDTSDD